MKPVDIANAILENEWNPLHKRLTAYALRLFGALGVIDGISPDDLAGETLMEYWADEGGLGYDPRRGSLERYLCSVVKNKFLMHLRRDRKLISCLQDDSVVVREQQLTDVGDSPSAKAIAEKANQIVTAARGDKELEELVGAAQGLDDGGKVNQQLSVLLGTTIEDVVNRKRRLTRRVDRTRHSLHRERTQT